LIFIHRNTIVRQKFYGAGLQINVFVILIVFEVRPTF
jgi:hypothetical protein